MVSAMVEPKKKTGQTGFEALVESAESFKELRVTIIPGPFAGIFKSSQ